MDSQLALGASVARRPSVPAGGKRIVFPTVVTMSRLRIARPSRERAEDRAAIGVQHQYGSPRIRIFGEALEFAGGVRGYIADRRNPDRQLAPQALGRPLTALLEFRIGRTAGLFRRRCGPNSASDLHKTA